MTNRRQAPLRMLARLYWEACLVLRGREFSTSPSVAFAFIESHANMPGSPISQRCRDAFAPPQDEEGT